MGETALHNNRFAPLFWKKMPSKWYPCLFWIGEKQHILFLFFERKCPQNGTLACSESVKTTHFVPLFWKKMPSKWYPCLCWIGEKQHILFLFLERKCLYLLWMSEINSFAPLFATESALKCYPYASCWEISTAGISLCCQLTHSNTILVTHFSLGLQRHGNRQRMVRRNKKLNFLFSAKHVLAADFRFVVFSVLGKHARNLLTMSPLWIGGWFKT